MHMEFSPSEAVLRTVATGTDDNIEKENLHVVVMSASSSLHKTFKHQQWKLTFIACYHRKGSL